MIPYTSGLAVRRATLRARLSPPVMTVAFVPLTPRVGLWHCYGLGVPDRLAASDVPGPTSLATQPISSERGRTFQDAHGADDARRSDANGRDGDSTATPAGSSVRRDVAPRECWVFVRNRVVAGDLG